MTPFADAALDLAGYGLMVVPLGGDDGKKPLVTGFTKWRGQRAETVERYAAKFPDANLGIVHGRLSRTTVVDIDNPSQIGAAISCFGETPLAVETPRGGMHLFYRNGGERCADLRRYGLEADMKAAGGVSTAPPSIRPSGRYKGRTYRLIRGTWVDLARLPTIKPGSLPQPSGHPSPVARRESREPSHSGRNNTLFHDCLRYARQCQNLDGLLESARMRNREFSPPLPDNEVARTAASAWRIQCEGRNRVGQGAQFIAPFSLLSKLRGSGDAIDLYVFLREYNAGLRVTFIISPKGMTEANAISGWKRRRYEVARDCLLERGLIEMVYKGGRYRGDVSKFRFSDPISNSLYICPIDRGERGVGV